MPRNEKPKTVSAQDIEQVADTLEHFATRYRDLAHQLIGTPEFDQLVVRNWTSMEGGIDKIRRAVSKAFEAFDAAKVAIAFGAQAEQMATDDQAKKSTRKRSPRKKQ